MAKKQIEMITMTYEEFHSVDVHYPSKLMFRDAMGNYVFLKCAKRDAAQARVDEEYGTGKFTVRVV